MQQLGMGVHSLLCVKAEGGKVVQYKMSYHTQVGEMFWVVGLGGKPVTRRHSPKTEAGASSKSVMTRPLKNLSLASILPVC